jgi:hypothetical protein
MDCLREDGFTVSARHLGPRPCGCPANCTVLNKQMYASDADALYAEWARDGEIGREMCRRVWSHITV